MSKTTKTEKPAAEVEEIDFAALMGLDPEEDEADEAPAKSEKKPKGETPWWEGYAENEEEAKLILTQGRRALEIIADPEEALAFAETLKEKYGKPEAPKEEAKGEAAGDDPISEILGDTDEADLLPTERALVTLLRKAQETQDKTIKALEDANKRIERMEAEITGGIPLAEMEHLREATGKIKADFGVDVAPSTLKELMESSGTKDPILAFKASQFDETRNQPARTDGPAPRDVGNTAGVDLPEDASLAEIWDSLPN